jgi:hypothetical protein
LSFPLPHGHYFGLNPFDVRCHTGDDNWVDEARIKAWQRKYSLTWDRAQPATGRFDGPTQRAVVAVQRKLGLPVSAVLDEDTWRAVFDGLSATETASHDVAPTEVPPETREAPEGHSEASVRVAVVPNDDPKNRIAIDEETLPEPPAWFNSPSPVGMSSRGPVVRKIRTLLGMQPRDTWSSEVTQRVRGLQKTHRLPVTGWVDTRTAVVLDGLPAKR